MRLQRLVTTNRPDWTHLMSRVDIETKMQVFNMFGYCPHPGQMLVHESRERIRCLCCGRRWGKSVCAAAESIVCAVLGGGVWALAPNYELSSVVFDQALAFVTNSPLSKFLAAEPRTARGRQAMVFQSGGWILGKSSHKPRSLLGFGLDLVVYDEAATEDNEEIVHQYIRPVLADRAGSFLPISTPRGDNWFKDTYDKGQMKVRGYASWQMPSSTNPKKGLAAEIASLAADLPEVYYKQEFLAEFLDNAGVLFRGYRDVSILETMAVTDPSMGFAIGIDIAKYEDYTVLSVIEIATGREVWLERFNMLDWPVIEARIAACCERFPGAPALVDSTGVGDRVFRALEDLLSDRMLESFKFSNATKVNIMNQLALAIQNQEIWFIGKDVLAHDSDYKLGRYAMGEMSAFRYERTPGGSLTMNAPPGKHDDVVTARALALECANRYGGGLIARGTKTGADPAESFNLDRMVEQFGNAALPKHGSANFKRDMFTKGKKRPRR